MRLVRTLINTWDDPPTEMSANWAIIFALLADLLFAALWSTAFLVDYSADVSISMGQLLSGLLYCLLGMIWLATVFETWFIGLGTLARLYESGRSRVVIFRVGISVLLSLAPLVWLIWMVVIAVGNMD